MCPHQASTGSSSTISIRACLAVLLFSSTSLAPRSSHSRFSRSSSLKTIHLVVLQRAPMAQMDIQRHDLTAAQAPATTRAPADAQVFWGRASSNGQVSSTIAHPLAARRSRRERWGACFFFTPRVFVELDELIPLNSRAERVKIKSTQTLQCWRNSFSTRSAAAGALTDEPLLCAMHSKDSETAILFLWK